MSLTTKQREAILKSLPPKTEKMLRAILAEMNALSAEIEAICERQAPGSVAEFKANFRKRYRAPLKLAPSPDSETK